MIYSKSKSLFKLAISSLQPLERNILHYCCKLLIEKFGQGSAETWTEANYTALEDAIFKKAKIKVSKEELKQLLSERNNESPQKSTKTALARYLAFDSWAEFVESAEGDLGIQHRPDLDNEEKYYWMVYAGGALILILALAFVMYRYGR